MKIMDPELSNDTRFVKILPFNDDVATFKLYLFNFFHQFPRFFDNFFEFIQTIA